MLSAVVLLLIISQVAATAFQAERLGLQGLILQKRQQQTLSGKKIAQATDIYKSSTRFGVVMMADDSLTETMDPQSMLVGRAQGLYSLLGNNRLRTFVHEMPIVSGTGVFLLPRSIGWLLNLAMPLLDTML
ncbi:hypothetical protein CUMW_222640 [Citrus unshiu]|uniref:Dirigent protein n=1 Tax=Citrus unshiu TaxID=55188 RepID=A0A2H5QEK5_CITUN|nr:hypothetical protein CUMW_222640 [Citrus unshiu]